jgi:hypothetical protein
MDDNQKQYDERSLLTKIYDYMTKSDITIYIYYYY